MCGAGAGPKVWGSRRGRQRGLEKVAEVGCQGNRSLWGWEEGGMGWEEGGIGQEEEMVG